MLNENNERSFWDDFIIIIFEILYDKFIYSSSVIHSTITDYWWRLTSVCGIRNKYNSRAAPGAVYIRPIYA